MKTKSLTFLLPLLALLTVFSGTHALAVIVDFTDMDRGPSPTLQIDGVTISPGTAFWDTGSMPATVAGIGLGSATIGSFGTLDRIQGPGTTPFERESLSLTVFGSLNSITITPYFSIVGSKEQIFLPFDISLSPLYLGPFHAVFSDSPVTFGLTSSIFGPTDHIEIGLQSDFGNPFVVQYLQEHPGAVAQFGFSITSLDYTPAGVPETSTVMLFVVGLAGLGLLRRKLIA